MSLSHIHFANRLVLWFSPLRGPGELAPWPSRERASLHGAGPVGRGLPGQAWSGAGSGALRSARPGGGASGTGFAGCPENPRQQKAGAAAGAAAAGGSEAG